VVASASSSRPRARLANIPDGGGAREVSERLTVLGHAGVNAADLLRIRVIRENPASRGTETSAEVLVGPARE
jgi:hypothetical protein